MKTIAIDEFKKLHNKQQIKTLIDVRSPKEFEEIHVEGAVNIPLEEVSATKIGLQEGPIYLICRSGGRSKKAQEKLLAEGLSNTINVLGGTEGAKNIGVPITAAK